MISVKEAENLINEVKFSAEIKKIPLKEAAGHYLAKSITADRPFPPFDRVAMDGIAILYEAFEKGNEDFPIEKTQFAGDPQTELTDPHACIEIMTGCILPKNADTVIPYEEIERTGAFFKIRSTKITKGQNIHFMGSDSKKDEELVAQGCKLSPAEIGIAASVGLNEIEVLTPPRIAILGTGDELVPVEVIPEPHQIRMSNAHTVHAALSANGLESKIFHLKDSQEELNDGLEKILQEFPILMIIGGASKGKADLVPETLLSLGVKKLFHGVRQRPGKPFWFGKSSTNIVFGFPGNPVSSYLCLVRYALPWLKSVLGTGFELEKAILAEEFEFKKEMTFFVQGRKTISNGKILIHPMPGGGSGDLVNLSKTDGFLELPAEQEKFGIWESYNWIPFR